MRADRGRVASLTFPSRHVSAVSRSEQEEQRCLTVKSLFTSGCCDRDGCLVLIPIPPSLCSNCHSPNRMSHHPPALSVLIARTLPLLLFKLEELNSAAGRLHSADP
ncbi:hypothetical protein GOODEAATRI_034012 [Goodea atripinnis]|uniref:Uncharacterized protein n=1 Tax=Goodea atripinnis TaxID=208336 RepID=A0ABV0NHH1_9TELE